MAYANGVSGEQRSPGASELLVLEAQKTILEQRIVYLRQNLAGNSHGLKRSASGPAHPEHGKGPKRAKPAHQDRAEALFAKCRTMLTQLKKSSNAGPFLNPVDPVELKCYDYFDIVKQPMDMKTVGSKLKMGDRVYTTPLEFRDDMRQIFENCRLYNPEGHPVRVMGDKLRTEFEKKWLKAGIEQQWHDLTNSCEAPPPKRPLPASTSVPTNASCDTTNHRTLTSPAGAPAISPRPPSKPVVEPPQNVSHLAEMVELERELMELTESGQRHVHPSLNETSPMPFAQRRQLSRKLDSLPEERLPEVGKILAEREAGVGDEEIHLDWLDNKTLWRLYQWVESVAPSGLEDDKLCNVGD
ncbi:hypothetical protein BSKO_00593 [Bryopsis sp. KO-2023]|nr:hypothetical protein BSKO_00593 [Bryopsis sp. KO-2023]